ncbi:MAG TPA: SGNH/GDSL hydrolase family protein [Dongiaceae bacterium]|nr:SGNH/GDSL hydrolase family protein [Dongiaceae bacterium]
MSGPPVPTASAGAPDSGRPPGRGRLRALLVPFLVSIVSLSLLEAGVRLLTGIGFMPALRRLNSDDSFWDGSHPVCGVWHHNSVSARHHTACFDVTYTTNSVGARDAERSLQSDRPRVVVLGDSYLEGWGVPVRERLSNILEERTGREHINLAMSHFGPYQEYLVYASLGKKYSHSGVIVGIFPFNDFYDLDYAVGRRSPGYLYAYRPYLVGQYPAYQRVDYRESDLAHFLRHHIYTYDAVSLAWGSIGGRGEGFDSPAALRESSGIVRSFYYDYSPAQFDLLRYCLEEIVQAAEGRPVAVVLVPAPTDFLRYSQSGDSPLAKQLEALGAERGFRLVDLLPPMSASDPNWEEYSLSCDMHWSAKGNATAADILETRLRGFLY